MTNWSWRTQQWSGCYWGKPSVNRKHCCCPRASPNEPRGTGEFGSGAGTDAVVFRNVWRVKLSNGEERDVSRDRARQLKEAMGIE
jgi:hypothetical protein